MLKVAEGFIKAIECIDEDTAFVLADGLMNATLYTGDEREYLNDARRAAEQVKLAAEKALELRPARKRGGQYDHEGRRLILDLAQDFRKLERALNDPEARRVPTPKPWEVRHRGGRDEDLGEERPLFVQFMEIVFRACGLPIEDVNSKIKDVLLEEKEREKRAREEAGLAAGD